ncbi:MAG: hypothetical protein HYX40_10660 [Sphingobacteriales bacterium]|nr:hypothetical protein [Sphingobacteriales bacterium]
MKTFLITVIFITGFISANGGSNKTPGLKLNTVLAADFAGAQNVEWSSDADFYYASFTQDSKSITAVYGKETTEYIGYLKTIGADNLPSSIRKIITENYIGFKAIGTVAEIGGDNKDSYIFTLENEKQVLKVKADTDGNTRILSKLKK